MQVFFRCSGWGLLFVVLCKLLIAVALLVAEHWSRVWAPILQMRTLRLREFICNLPTVPEQ